MKTKIFIFYLLSINLIFNNLIYATDDKPGEAKKSTGLKSNVNLSTQNSLQLSLLEINEKLEQNTLKVDLMADLKEKLSLAPATARLHRVLLGTAKKEFTSLFSKYLYPRSFDPTRVAVCHKLFYLCAHW